MSELRSASRAASMSSSGEGRAAAAGAPLLTSRSRSSIASPAGAAGAALEAAGAPPPTSRSRSSISSPAGAAGAGAGWAGAADAGGTLTPADERRSSTALSSAAPSSTGGAVTVCGWLGISRWFSRSSTSSMPGMTIFSLGFSSGPWDGASGPERLGEWSSSTLSGEAALCPISCSRLPMASSDACGTSFRLCNCSARLSFSADEREAWAEGSPSSMRSVRSMISSVSAVMAASRVRTLIKERRVL